MISSEQNEKLVKILQATTRILGYMPFQTELSYTTIPVFQGTLINNIELLPQNKDTDPVMLAQKYTIQFHGENTCVLLPGKQFDMHGTRHGRGYGWYDRFLANIPTNWIRIGVINDSNLSRNILVKNTWDEPVDWILSLNESFIWKVYETSARVLV